jgi:hypothetical protein
MGQCKDNVEVRHGATVLPTGPEATSGVRCPGTWGSTSIGTSYTKWPDRYLASLTTILRGEVSCTEYTHSDPLSTQPRLDTACVLSSLRITPPVCHKQARESSKTIWPKTSHGNAGVWKACTTKKPAFHPSHTPWKSLRGFPHYHGYDCGYH